MTGSFNCVCGYTVITESDDLLASTMEYHAKSCPGPKRSAWSYIFSEWSFLITLGMSGIAWAVAGIFN